MSSGRTEGRKGLAEGWTRRRWLRYCAWSTLGLGASTLPGVSWLRAQEGEADEGRPAVGNGVSIYEVRIGMSGGFVSLRSGPSREYLRGSLAWLNEVNSRGGVRGRRLTLLAQDDGGDPGRAAANTAELLRSGVLCLYGFTGTANVLRSLPVIERHGDPDLRLVGALPSPRSWLHGPYAERVISTRPSLDAEIAFLLRPLIRSGRRRFGLYLPLDPGGRALAQAVAEVLAAAGCEAPIDVGFRPSSALEKGLEAATETLTSEGAEAVLCSGGSGPAADFVRYVRDADWAVPILLDSSVDGEAVLDRLKESPPRSGPIDRLVQTRSTPTFDFSGLAGARAEPEMALYLEMMAKWKPRIPEALLSGDPAEREPTALGFEGFRNARVLTEAMDLAGAELDRSSFRRALEQITDTKDRPIDPPVASLGVDEPVSDEPVSDDPSPGGPGEPADDGVAQEDAVAADSVRGFGSVFAVRANEGRWVDVDWVADDPWVEQL